MNEMTQGVVVPPGAIPVQVYDRVLALAGVQVVRGGRVCAVTHFPKGGVAYLAVKRAVGLGGDTG